ncbi:MAG: hypothetical protein JO092_08760, partial [Candidatus Eremiobacteraeota bacterium]|nr:hypothetical protein [Candidatus Eremiobacteraeota bacterium]
IVLAATIWRQAIARAAIVELARAVAHVQLAFESSSIGWSGADFTGVRVTSLQQEPIADLSRFSVRYNLHDLIAGTRLFGLEALALDRPRLTIIRRPDGTFNIPTPPSGGKKKQPPLRMITAIAGGSIDIVNEGRSEPVHLYVRGITARAQLSTTLPSHYDVAFSYGERSNRLYPIRGNGVLDARSGYTMQRWRAPELPLAGAVNFVVDSPQLHVAAGALHDLDARIFSLPAAGKSMQPHLAATADLRGMRVAVAGLSKPIENLRGRIDVDENGLLVKRLDASIAGLPVAVAGGAFAPRLAQGDTSIQVRLAVRGSGGIRSLRSALAQAARLPVDGPIAFGMLAEGNLTKPLSWIALQSPRVTYAGSSVDGTHALVAFDGREADVAHFVTRYHGAELSIRGRAALQRRPNAVEMLLSASVPPNAFPYEQNVAPGLQLHGVALAAAQDPKAIALRALVSGWSPSERLAGTVDVAANGTGSVGPLVVAQGRGHDVVMRAALDRLHNAAVAFFDAHDFGLANLGTARGEGVVAIQRKAVAGRIAATLRQGGGLARMAATIAGTPSAPRLAATVVLDRARYARYDLNGSASLAYADGTLNVRNALAQLGPAFVSADGTVAGLAIGRIAPRYDIAARVQSGDAGALLAAQPRVPLPVEGSFDANLHVGGTLAAPDVSGTFAALEGSINGLAFRDLNATVGGTPQAMTLRNGRVVVGSTAIAFNGAANGGSMQATVAAPRADLADFNDFFDAGDMFAGRGDLAFDASLSGTHLLASNGSAHFANARFRRMELGTVAARWHDRNGALTGNVAMGGPTGEFSGA